MKLRHVLPALVLAAAALPLHAEEYTIDTHGAHAAIQFRI